MLDEFLVDALSSDAAPLLKMERELEAFLADTGAVRFHFPVASSFLRLMAHRLCHHFGLRHTVVAVGGAGGGKAVCAFKTPDTRLPPIRLADLVDDTLDASGAAPRGAAPVVDAPASKVLVLRRQHDSVGDSGLPNRRATSEAPAQSSLVEREAKYMEAKMRIFGREVVEAHVAEERAEQLQAAASQPARSPVREHKAVDLFADSTALPQRQPLSVASIPEFIPGRGLVGGAVSPPYASGRAAAPSISSEFHRPPPRTNGRLFDPHAPAYTMAPRSQLPVMGRPAGLGDASGKGASRAGHERVLQTPHIRFASGVSVDVVRRVCEPLGARSVRAGADCVVVVFGSSASAAQATSHVDALVPRPFVMDCKPTVVAVTDPNAGTGANKPQ